jgi:tetratricopeptide (TPR) repeat protein
MESRQPAVHRTILVVDIEGFGDRRRTNSHQVTARDGMYQALRKAFDQSDVSWTDCRYEDRGDGVFILAPAEMPKAPFVDAVPYALAAALCEHNTTHLAEEQIRVRMAVHAGEVAFDDHGVTATSVNLAFRLLDAPPVKRALAESPGMLVLVTSGWFFDEVVRHSQKTDPATYRPIRVVVKETSTVGWISLPDHPYLGDPKHLMFPSLEPLPRQLPAAPRSFTGRVDELATLTSALDSAAGQGGTVVISAIAGTGGIGKTWLALHWAHQHLDRFPDGHLFVDLNGFSPNGQPMTPATAVRGFLDALGIDAARIPVDPEAQAALYRSQVAGRRMLIVLDNARTTAQVAPLLPGSPTATVLITSRDRLTGLITARGARLLPVDVLSEHEARDLLVARLGADRVAAEPSAVGELLGCCGGFPLALSIVAGRAEAHPDFPLAVLAAELRDTTTRLGILDDRDPAASLPAVMSWSYNALPAEQARVFGLVGVVPGPDISLPAAANLTNLTVPQIQALLRGLEDVHLIQQHVPGRYRMHNLIRLYAAEQADHDFPEKIRTAGLRRLTDFYLHTAYAAELLLEPNREVIQIADAAAGCHPRPLEDEAAAWAWCTAEHLALLATQQLAAERGWYMTVWQLAWALGTFHARRGHLHEAVVVWRAGLAAAVQLGDPAIRALAHRRLGEACTWAGLPDNAVGHLQQALTLAETAGDLSDQAHTHRALAWAWERRGDDRRALEHATHALHLFHELEMPVREGDALNAVGWYEARLRDYEQARIHCEAALTLARRHEHRAGEAVTLDSLGYIAYHTGHHLQALDCYQQSLTVCRDLGFTYQEADTLDCLGQTHQARGQHDLARAAWQEALDLYQAQHRTSDADRVHHRLTTLETSPHCPADVKTSQGLSNTSGELSQ